MNRIYKVIWSKVKHQYIVVSELAHRDGKQCAKAEKSLISDSICAKVVALLVTGSVFFAPYTALAADNGADSWSDDTQGNHYYYFTDGEAPTRNQSKDNIIIGDSNKLTFVDYSFLLGNNINISGSGTDGINFGHDTNTLIIGNDAYVASSTHSVIIGDNADVGAAENSLIIGDDVSIVSGKEGNARINSTVVIGDDVQIGHRLESGGGSASAAGDNITVIGDHVLVDNESNRTGSSNSLIFGNDVNMNNSQNSVAIGNDLSVRGTNDVGDNISIGHDITLGGDNSTASTHSMIAMGNNIQAYGHDNILFGNNIDITDNAGIHGVVVMGTEADATGFDGVAIGTNATSDGNYALAFGGESTATGIAAIAIGKKDVVSASYGTGLGAYATIGSKSDGSTALGSWASVGENSMAAIAIGGAPFLGGAHATIGNDADYSIAIGIGANIADEAQDSIALGSDASVVPEGLANSSFRGVAIGYDATVNGQSGTAIGDTATASGRYSMAMGQGSTVTDAGMYSTAIGANANAAAAHGIAIGTGAKLSKSGTNGMGGIAFGYQAAVDVSQGIAIGSNSNVESNASGSIALGEYATINEGSTYSIAIGAAGAQAGNKPPEQPTEVGNNSDYSIALGYGASIKDNSGWSVAMGRESSVASQQAVAMGYMSEIGTNSNFSVAIGGREAKVVNDSEYGTAYGGYSAIVNADGGTALGSYTQVDSAYSTAVGYKSKVTADDIFTADDLADFKNALGANYIESYNIKASDISNAGVFSVGSKDSERRIINVARGRISEESTDAVNGSQLYGLASDLNQKIEKAGGNWTLTTNGGPNDAEKTTVGKGDIVDFSGAKDEATQHQNIQISQEQTTDPGGNVTGTKVSVDLNDRVELGTGDEQIVIDANPDEGNLSIGGNIQMNASGTATFGGIKLNQDQDAKDNPQHASTITGLTNTEWNQEGTYNAGRAATEEQLQDAIGEVNKNSYKGWNLKVGDESTPVTSNDTVLFQTDKNDKGASNLYITKDGLDVTIGMEDEITLTGVTADRISVGPVSINKDTGIDAGGFKITNVHAGEISASSHDAVNGSQLYALADEFNQQIEAAGNWNLTTNNGAATTIHKGNTVDFAGAKDENGHQNIRVSQTPVTDEEGNVIGTNVSFDLNNRVELGTGADQIILDGENGMAAIGSIRINGKDGTINNLTNLTWNPDHYVTGQAATEDQLHQAISSVETNFQQNDQHLVANPDTENGHYSVDDKNQVNLQVQNGVDENGNPKYNTVTIDNVAQASDVGDVGKFHDDVKNQDGSHTTVVDAINNIDTRVDQVEVDIDNLGDRIDGVEETAGKHSSVSNTDGNITVDDTGKNDAGGVDYVVGLNNDKITVGDETNNVTIEGTKGSITVTNSVSAGQTTISDEGVSVGGNTYITDKGINANNQVITNVAAGVDDTDAVNVSQLKGVEQRVENNSMAITNIGNKVDKLDNRIDEVGAGAAALAALHPLDFDPDDKWDFAAGYGHYRGENAVAIGAFYRPNEDTMFSVGGTVGNDDNMINAGVSFKIGQGNGVSTSRVAMAKEIKSMRDIVAKQDAQIQKLTAMVNALVGMEAIAPDTTTMFPDVPENHWAYEAVEMMAKTGLVQGYPDGEFKGDRSMTRYEFAQIVYNAIQAGIKVDERLVQEFRPELEYFRIDTISKDKDGNPVIQRVRANDVPTTK